MEYWLKRLIKSQESISNKNIKDTEKQLRKYYVSAAKKVIDEFEATYDKLLATLKEDKEPTPADLYKLDRYWQMQAQMREELQKLGDKQIQIMSKAFEVNYFEIYYTSIASLIQSTMYLTSSSVTYGPAGRQKPTLKRDSDTPLR